jgi:hypothetical protein
MRVLGRYRGVALLQAPVLELPPGHVTGILQGGGLAGMGSAHQVVKLSSGLLVQANAGTWPSSNAERAARFRMSCGPSMNRADPGPAAGAPPRWPKADLPRLRLASSPVRFTRQGEGRDLASP